MRLRGVLAIFLLLGSVVKPVAAQSWLCTGDQSIGFSKEKEHWKGSRFKAKSKWIVKPLPQRLHKYLNAGQRKLKYGAYKFGFGPSYCTSSFVYRETWQCGNFYFNMKTLRFLKFFEGGYVHSFDNSDTPNIEIGTCAVLE